MEWNNNSETKLKVSDENGNMICLCTTSKHGIEQAIRNARLIATAPELLDACLWALQNGAMVLDMRTLEMLRAVTQKALDLEVK